MLNRNVKTQILYMWNKGLSGGEIAETLKVTRGAVLGYVHRARMSGALLEERAIGNNTHKYPKQRIKKYEQSRIDGINGYFVKPEYGLSILDLGYTNCRFIVSEDADKPPIYCGEEIDRGSYCKTHADLCYVPARSQLEKLVSNRRNKPHDNQ